jgi:hypothetical protein
VIGEERRAIGGADPGNIGEVLDRNRKSGKPTRLAGGFAGCTALHDAVGMVASPIKTQGRQRIYRRLDLRDAAGGGVNQVERRELALL